MVKTAFFAADQDEGAQRGSGRPIPPLVSEIQAATTNTGTKPQGGLTPDFLALSKKASISGPNPSGLKSPSSTWAKSYRDWAIFQSIESANSRLPPGLPAN